MSRNKAKNKYLKRAHISEKKFRALLKHFCLDDTATKASLVTKISRPTINKLFSKLRLRLAASCEYESSLSGEIEVDESYFGPHRVRGKKGRGAFGKTPVIGLLKRGGKVYTQIVKDCTRASLMPVIQGKVIRESSIYTDGWKSYDGLVLNGYKHYRIHHTENEFARGKNHVNGIESFWSFAKRRLAKFNGISPKTFYVHVKECEFRWNHKQELYQLLLKTLKQNPL